MSPDNFPALHIKRKTHGARTATLALVGEIDVESAPDLATALTELLEDDVDAIRLDFAGVAFMDSTGIHVLLTALGDLHVRHPSGTITIENPADVIRRVLEVTNLTEFFGL